MNRLLLVVLLLCAGFFASAQNWKTVALNDTNYFMAGKHIYHWWPPSWNSAYPITPDTSILRMMYVRNYSLAGTDTVYNFCRTFRDTAMAYPTPNPPCADTAAASWLGYRCIRNATSGIEYYFNGLGDSIVIHTKGNLGDGWTLANDTVGHRFAGTVTQVGVQFVDGFLDSFKTISIQAYNGSIPLPNLYNSRVLQLSKNHGWLKTLDFYRFPNNTWGSDRGGIALDSTQHLRLPKAASNIDLKKEDLAWKYAPGNEWIRLSDIEPTSPTISWTESAWYDSVMAFQTLTASSALVTFKTVHFDKYGYLTSTGPKDTSTIIGWIHTDTVRSIPWGVVSRKIETYYQSAMHDRYFISPYDTTRYFIKRADIIHPNYGFSTSPTCLTWPRSVSIGFEAFNFETYLPGFGQTELYFYNQDVPYYYRYWRYSYIKTGGSSWGTKINVAALGIEQNTAAHSYFKIYPNPANDHFTVTSSSSLPASMVLKNVTGQQVWTGQLTGASYSIPTSSLTAGLYFLEILTKEHRHTSKVIVQH
jgi:hypothetical protein